jgi:hypothetical protein
MQPDVRRPGGSALWSPGRAWWWIALLFAVGSSCFLVGPLPGVVSWIGPQTDAVVFFVGSLFFTVAAALQWWDCLGGAGMWSSSIQLVGTLFFNATTFRALTTTLGSSSYDRLVWRPDALGSICFLVSGVVAYAAVPSDGRRTAEGRMALVNLLGCVAFGLAALGAYVLPSSTGEVSVTAANVMTSLGALGFLVGSLMLVRVGAQGEAARSRVAAQGPAVADQS